MPKKPPAPARAKGGELNARGLTRPADATQSGRHGETETQEAEAGKAAEGPERGGLPTREGRRQGPLGRSVGDVPIAVGLAASPSSLVAASTQTAEWMAGLAWRSGRVVSLTKGQINVLDVILALARRCDPCEVCISTWAIDGASIEGFDRLIRARPISRFRLLITSGFPGTRPDLHRAITERWGDAVVLARTHAKFATIRGAGRAFTVLTSGNLNANRRFENLTIDDDLSICAFFEAHVDELHSAQSRALSPERALSAAMGGGRARTRRAQTARRR